VNAGETLRVRVVPVVREGEVVGALETGLSQEDMDETLRTLLVILAAAYPLTLATAAGGGLLLSGRALSPVDRVTGLARRISADDLGQRLNLDLPDDELGRLARTFDDMIGRLDASFQRQRQFTADASHELRTPLTAIKGQAEVALQKDREPEAYRRVLEAINEEVDRMIRLTAGLLTLARADAGQGQLTLEQVDLAGIVAAAAGQVRPAAGRQGVRLEVAAGPAATLKADKDLLIQLLLNLLDNAVKHTPAGGTVTVGWQAGDGTVALRVTDTGAGIAPEHLPHIFDRFYRADSARSRAQGGAGLGLSICRWIAEAHGGAISAESAEGRGSAFIVRLPLAP
jgi:heavy metal sensor kinase